MPTSSSLRTRESSESSSTFRRSMCKVSGEIGEEAVVECSEFDKIEGEVGDKIIVDESTVDSIVLGGLYPAPKRFMIQCTSVSQRIPQFFSQPVGFGVVSWETRLGRLCFFLTKKNRDMSVIGP